MIQIVQPFNVIVKQFSAKMEERVSLMECALAIQALQVTYSQRAF